MSIFALPNASNAAAAAAPRRGVEPSSRREAGSFSLPEEPGADARATDARTAEARTTETRTKEDRPAERPAVAREASAGAPGRSEGRPGGEPVETAQPAKEPSPSDGQAAAGAAAPAEQTGSDGASLLNLAFAAQIDVDGLASGNQAATADGALAGADGEPGPDARDVQAVSTEAAGPEVATAAPEPSGLDPAALADVFAAPPQAPGPVSPATAAEAGRTANAAPGVGPAAAPTAVANLAGANLLAAGLADTSPAAAAPGAESGASEAGPATEPSSPGGQAAAAPAPGEGAAELAAKPAIAANPADARPVETGTSPGPAPDLSALAQPRPRADAITLPTGLDPAAAADPHAAGQPGAQGGTPTPLHVVPLEIGLRALAGSKRFDIRLDPAELGRVDVALDISDSGEVSARLVVDRVETLHLLQRDARTLERAFEQAGLKPTDGGVEISLRDPSDQSGARQHGQDGQAPRRSRVSDSADEQPIPAQPAPVRRLVRLGGVDLSI